MKTKFFKKLSFVLVAAMVLSLFVPAAGAFAAANPKLNSTNKYLHLGVEGYDEFNFNIANKKKGWQYYWESADEDVVVVNEKNGVVTAAGVGKTTITCEITDADDKEVDTLEATVTVRDNIKEVKISNPVEGTIAVGETYDFNRSFTTVSGSTKKTSAITRWSVEPAEGAEINDKGVFTASKSGEYKVIARSFQSKARYTAWLADATANADYVLDIDETAVVVAAEMETPEQLTLRKVKVPFTSEVEDADKDITFSVMIGTAKVKVSTVKSVTLADDKKSVTIELYTDFTPEATYVIDHPTMGTQQFVAVKTGADQVASVELDTTTATVNQWTAISYILRNADGVDITSSVNAGVTISATTTKGIFANNKLYFVNVGDTAEVTVKFNAYKWENGKDISEKTATGTVTAVAAAASTITGAKAYTIINASGTPDYSDVKHILSVSDTGTSAKQFFIQLNKLVGSDASTIDSSDNAEAGKFKYTTSDKSILIIDNAGNLYPIKEGEVQIVVTYDNSVVAVIPVTVSPKREAKIVIPSTRTISLSNANVGDYKDVSFKVYDNLGEEMTVSLDLGGCEKLAGSPATSIIGINGSNYRFSGQGAVAGTYNYKIKVNELYDYITVVVSAPDNNAGETYIAEVSSSEVDLKSDGINNTDVTITLYSYKGVKDSAIAVSGAGFKVIVKDPDGNDTVLPTNTYNLVSVVSGGAITKKPVGTYLVTVQKAYVDPDSGETFYYDVYSTSFTTKDTTEAPTFEVNTLQSTQSSVLGAVKECFKFKLGNEDITSSVTIGPDQYIGAAAGTDIYVKSVTYKQTVGNATLTHTINVGLNITKKAAQ
jgi:hypothetical protein